MRKYTALLAAAAFIGSTTLVAAFYTPKQDGFGNTSDLQLVQAKKDDKGKGKDKDKGKGKDKDKK